MGRETLTLWIARYFRWRDLLPLGMLVCFGLIISEPGTLSSKAAILAAVAYLILFFIWGSRMILRRRAGDRVQIEVLRGLFSQMNKDIFKDDNSTRFTLFHLKLDEKIVDRAGLSLTAVCIRSLPFIGFIIFAFLTIGSRNISPLKGFIFLFIQVVLLVLSLLVWIRR
ncbi:MAG: hypothetical protein ACREEM_33795 [Blastocatellia bacterium]